MKTFSFVFSLAFCLFTSFHAAAMPDTGEETQHLRRELARMIDAPQLEEMGVDQTLAMVSFIISEDNEILVKGVAAASEEIKTHIKQEINGRKLKQSSLQHGQLYRLKVTFRKSS